jgi:hypothetical protein
MTFLCSRRLAAAITGGVCLSVLLPLASAPPAAAATTPLRVFAVGDSYASGEGAIGGGWTNAFCHRSPLAGPEDASVRLGALRPVVFTSLACTGSVTGSGIGAGILPGTAAKSLLGAIGQLAGVGAPGERVDALSLSIGGNDLGFASLVTSCMVPAYDCSTDPAVTGPMAASLASLPARLGAVAAGVQGPGRVVPGDVRNVFVTAYPDPTTALDGARCGIWTAPGFQGLDGVDANEAAFASASVVAPLNAALASMVSSANAAPGFHPVWHLVADIPARFATHGYCTGGGSPAPWQWPNPRYIATPVDSLTSQGDVFGTMHPNDLGQQQIGAALFEAERFLADNLYVSVTAGSTPRLSTPVDLTISARTARGTPAVRASVVIDGQLRGITDQDGRLWLPAMTFSSVGDHTVTVDLDPYPVASRVLRVAGYTYTISSNLRPIPYNKSVALLLTATDDTTGAVVPGTFTITGATAVTLTSGAGASVTVKPRYESYYDPDLGRVVREVICPSLVFTPADTAHYTAGGADLFDC